MFIQRTTFKFKNTEIPFRYFSTNETIFTIKDENNKSYDLDLSKSGVIMDGKDKIEIFNVKIDEGKHDIEIIGRSSHFDLAQNLKLFFERFKQNFTVTYYSKEDEQKIIRATDVYTDSGYLRAISMSRLDIDNIDITKARYYPNTISGAKLNGKNMYPIKINGNRNLIEAFDLTRTLAKNPLLLWKSKDNSEKFQFEEVLFFEKDVIQFRNRGNSIFFNLSQSLIRLKGEKITMLRAIKPEGKIKGDITITGDNKKLSFIMNEIVKIFSKSGRLSNLMIDCNDTTARYLVRIKNLLVLNYNLHFDLVGANLNTSSVPKLSAKELVFEGQRTIIESYQGNSYIYGPLLIRKQIQKKYANQISYEDSTKEFGFYSSLRMFNADKLQLIINNSQKNLDLTKSFIKVDQENWIITIENALNSVGKTVSATISGKGEIMQDGIRTLYDGLMTNEQSYYLIYYTFNRQMYYIKAQMVSLSDDMELTYTCTCKGANRTIYVTSLMDFSGCVMGQAKISDELAEIRIRCKLDKRKYLESLVRKFETLSKEKESEKKEQYKSEKDEYKPESERTPDQTPDYKYNSDKFNKETYEIETNIDKKSRKRSIFRGFKNKNVIPNMQNNESIIEFIFDENNILDIISSINKQEGEKEKENSIINEFTNEELEELLGEVEIEFL